MYKILIKAVEEHLYELSYTSYDARNTKYNEMREALRVAVSGVIEHDTGFVRIPMVISVEKI